MGHPVINVFQQIKVPATHLVSPKSDMWSPWKTQSYYNDYNLIMPCHASRASKSVFLLRAVYDIYGNILVFLNTLARANVQNRGTGS